MHGDIPGLTIQQFAIYYLLIALAYITCWVYFSWQGIKNEKKDTYWFALILSAVVVPYLIYIPFYKCFYNMGDTSYYYAYVKSIADGNFLNDLCYTGYPTYYPPLYFLLLGFLMWLIKAPLVSFFIYFPIFNIIFTCFFAFYMAKIIKDRLTGILYILMLFFVSYPGVAYLVGGMRVSSGLHWVVGVPHELYSAMLVILGIYIFSREEKYDKWWAGLICGIAALVSINYAVYFALSLLAYAAIRAIKTGNYIFHFSRLIVAGLIAFIISSIYLIPYFSSVLKHGSDDYQWKWAILTNYDPYLATFGLGFMGLTFVLGILGIITLPKSNFKLILIITLVVLYVGRFHIYVTKPLFNICYLPDHSYYALGFFLSFTGAIFLRDFPVKVSFKKWTLEKLKTGHIFLASTIILPIVMWNPLSNPILYNSFKPIPEKIQKITSIIQEKTKKKDIILASSELSPWILLLSERHLALSGNPWNSNPTARYSLRFKDFSEVFSIDDIKVIKNNLNKWNVDIIVLAKEDNNWGFNANSPEFGRIFRFPSLRAEVDKEIFDSDKYFQKLYEDEFYVVLRND